MRCPSCGEIYEGKEYGAECEKCEEDLEYFDLFDYFQDVLDVEYRIDRERNFKSAKILVAFGGPTIWVDTEKSKVILQWWNEHAEAEIDDYTNDAINELFEELYNC